MASGKPRDEFDTAPGPVPSRTARQGGAAAAAWALVAGLIAFVMLTPLLLPRPLPVTGVTSLAAAQPSPAASQSFGK